MKLKAVTVVVMVVMILQIAGNVMAKSCFEDCTLECKGDTKCLGICLGSCTGDGAQKPLDHHDLCKLGCTLDRCLKYSNDKNKMGTLVHSQKRSRKSMRSSRLGFAHQRATSSSVIGDSTELDIVSLELGDGR